jgi:hypothetical protein
VKIIFPNKRKRKNASLKQKTLGGYTQQTKPNQESKWMKMKNFCKIIIIRIRIISDNNNKILHLNPSIMIFLPNQKRRI